MVDPDSPAQGASRSDADAIESLLPQTQCTKCGFTGCRPYAEAIARGEAQINRCPPGGDIGIARLAALTGLPVLPLDPDCGIERDRRVAWIDPAACIGCTKCIQACPVDAIIGASKWMHAVIPTLCTGCDLCVHPCPVDCIDMREQPAVEPWSDAHASRAKARFVARNRRQERHRRRQDERLLAKAAGKLAALGEGSTPMADRASDGVQPDHVDPGIGNCAGRGDPGGSPTRIQDASLRPADPDAQRKRAIIEAAIARARRRLQT